MYSTIDTNKEIGAVFNNFNFQPDELLSSTFNDTMFGALSNFIVRFDENDATFLIFQDSSDHATLEATGINLFFITP